MNKSVSLDDLTSDVREHPLFRMALTHSSAAPSHNERLEFLGDAVLGLCITNFLYHDNPLATEGELSRKKSSLVNRVSLTLLADELELASNVIVGPGEGRGNTIRKSVLANTVEAILGAIYLIKGSEYCNQFILNIYGARLQSLPSAESLKDPKSRLQEGLQKLGLPLPSYELIQATGKAHERFFLIACRVASLSIETTGRASSRKAAEQAAAAEALSQLEHA